MLLKCVKQNCLKWLEPWFKLKLIGNIINDKSSFIRIIKCKFNFKGKGIINKEIGRSRKNTSVKTIIKIQLTESL